MNHRGNACLAPTGVSMLTSFFTTLFWISAALILYAYIVYPAILLLLQRSSGCKKPSATSYRPDVTLIISAYNEEKIIEGKIINSLGLEYPPGQLEIIIASDGSDDRTVEIAQKYINQGITLFDYPQRRGKVNVLNATVPKAQNAIIVLSDANTLFASDAIEKLVHHFADPKVGCVCGALQFVSAEGSHTGDLEGLYWKFETFLKKIEGARGALLGANGGIYALRKELFYSCPPETIVEDFVIPMKILGTGYKVLYEPQAVAVEETTKLISQEKQRRIRIGAGDFQALFLLSSMLNPVKGFPAFAFWSHKVIRWFIPFLLIGAFVSNLFLWHWPFYRLTFLLQGLFYLGALIGQILSQFQRKIKILSVCHYFVVMNVGLLLGFFRFLWGQQRVTWERTER